VTGVVIVYPEHRTLSDDQVEVMYLDAVVNDKIALGRQTARTVADMALALEDAGIISIGKERP